MYAVILLLALGVSVLPRTSFHDHSDSIQVNCINAEPEFLSLIGEHKNTNNCEDHDAHLTTEYERCELCDFAFNGNYTVPFILRIAPDWQGVDKNNIPFAQKSSNSSLSVVLNKGSPIC